MQVGLLGVEGIHLDVDPHVESIQLGLAFGCEGSAASNALSNAAFSTWQGHGELYSQRLTGFPQYYQV